MNPVETRVITLPLGLVSAFALNGERVVLFDTGYPGSEERILSGLAAQGLAGSDVSLILISHGHPDHAGSAGALHRLTGAPVAVHKLDAEALRRGGHAPVIPTGPTGRWLHRLMALTQRGQAGPLEPDLILEGRLSLDRFGVRAEVIPTPGHTPGSISVWIPGGPVLVGDLIMGGLLRRSRPGWPFFATDLGQVEASLRAVLALQPSLIHAAHGGPFSPQSVRKRWPGLV